MSNLTKVYTGNPYGRERISTVDLLILTSLDELIFILKMFVTFFTKQAALMRRSSVLNLPLQSVFPGAGNTKGGSITVPLTSCLTGLD